jgi:hypothetical protein
MFLAAHGRSATRNGVQARERLVGQGRSMDAKIYVMMLLIGFLSALYHAGESRDLEEG